MPVHSVIFCTRSRVSVSVSDSTGLGLGRLGLGLGKVGLGLGLGLGWTGLGLGLGLGHWRSRYITGLNTYSRISGNQWIMNINMPVSYWLNILTLRGGAQLDMLLGITSVSMMLYETKYTDGLWSSSNIVSDRHIPRQWTLIDITAKSVKTT